MIPKFIKAGAKITGFDISKKMIKLGKKRLKKLGLEDHFLRVGNVFSLRKVSSSSIDAIISFNVLTYLTDKEENVFYTEAHRILKDGGYLAVSHSNELFDMFSLNRYTVDFYIKYLLSNRNYFPQVKKLLRFYNKPEKATAYNIRENPLTYKHKLSKYGFQEVKQRFSNLHEAPPILLQNKSYPNTLRFPENERWKLMFICSSFLSLSVKKQKAK